jgi:HEAT repeat protein
LSALDLKARVAGGDLSDRSEAIRELCTRGHPSAIETLIGALETFTPNETAIAVAQLVSFGEAVGDDLIAALGSPREHIRQCAALGLGRLRLRRALAPLLKQLEAEESPIWPELARSFGDFGMGALRAVVRSIPGAARPERFGAVLGHLANHGCAKDVEKMENDMDPEVAQAARKAMARRSRMEWEDLAVREQRTLNDASAATRLSQLFFAEAPKADI